MRPHPKSFRQDGAATSQRWYFDGSLWVPSGVYVYVSSEGEQSTTSDTFVQALTLNTGTIPAGDYVVMWQAATRNTSLGFATDIRIQVDGSDLFSEHEYLMKDSSTNQRMPIAGCRRTTFGSSGSHDIDFDYHKESGSGTSYLYNVRLAIMDVNDTVVAATTIQAHRPRLKSLRDAGAAGDQRLAWNGSVWAPIGQRSTSESLSRSTTTSTSYSQKLKHTTPSLPAGKYLITWHALMDRSSTSGDVGIRVDLDNSDIIQEWELELPHDSFTQRSMFSGFVERTLTSGVHEVDVDWREASGGFTTGVQDVWITVEQVGF